MVAKNIIVIIGLAALAATSFLAPQQAVAATFCADFHPSALANLFHDTPANLPNDVSEFICRRAACEHWAGEDAYDSERGQEIEKAVHRLGCATIERDEAALRQRHQNNPKALESLDSTRYDAKEDRN